MYQAAVHVVEETVGLQVKASTNAVVRGQDTRVQLTTKGIGGCAEAQLASAISWLQDLQEMV